jgi:aquaporin NIP
MTPLLLSRLAAEGVGTALLVFIGGGALAVNAQTGALGHLGVALAFGLVIMAMVYATGHLSGAHLNPAVTLGFALVRHFPLPLVPLYWLAQLGGAALAAALLRVLFGAEARVSATVPSGSVGQALAFEVVLTFALMFVIMAVATDTRAVGQGAAIAIGGTVALGALVGGPVSGASLNPARSLGPAFAFGVGEHQWLYLLGPVLGALLGALAYQWLRAARPPYVRGKANA